MNKEHENINTLLVSISYGLSALELTKKMNEEIKDCPLLLNGPLKEEAMQKVSEANAAIADALGYCIGLQTIRVFYRLSRRG